MVYLRREKQFYFAKIIDFVDNKYVFEVCRKLQHNCNNNVRLVEGLLFSVKAYNVCPFSLFCDINNGTCGCNGERAGAANS